LFAAAQQHGNCEHAWRAPRRQDYSSIARFEEGTCTHGGLGDHKACYQRKMDLDEDANMGVPNATWL
jgi:hypothetical protein